MGGCSGADSRNPRSTASLPNLLTTNNLRWLVQRGGEIARGRGDDQHRRCRWIRTARARIVAVFRSEYNRRGRLCGQQRDEADANRGWQDDSSDVKLR